MRAVAAVGLAAVMVLAPVATPPALAGAPKTLEERVADLEKGATGFLRGIKLEGGIATSYNFNFNEPGTLPGTERLNDFRSFDPETNSFELDLVQVSLDRAAEPVGFRIDLDFGRIAHLIGTATRKDTVVGGLFGRDDDIEVHQAYIAFKPDFVSGVTVKGGRFTTLAGAEVIEPWKNFAFSRSFLFGLQPFTHTGLRANYGFGPVTATFGVVNGWDNVSDNNRGKTIEGQIAFAPSDMLSVTLTGYYGAELDDNDADKRTLGDLVVTVKPLPALTAIVNYDVFYDEASPTGVGGSAFAHGVAVTLHYDLTDRIGLTARGEYLRDEDNSRVPAPVSAGSLVKASVLSPLATRGATLYEGTATISYKVIGPVEARVEYRYDGSTVKNVFESDEGPRDQQQTITAALLLSF